MKHFILTFLLLALLMPATTFAANIEADGDKNVSSNETLRSNNSDVVFGELDPTRGELEIHYYGAGPANLSVFLNGEQVYLSNSVLQLPGHGNWNIGVLIEPYGPGSSGRPPFVVAHYVEFKYETPAPLIACVLYPKEVQVYIQWPESDGYPVYTGRYTYTRTNEDQFFDVEAFTTDNGCNYESEHAYETIWVPALEYDPTGDVNNDGVLDVEDISSLIQRVLEGH